MESNIIMIAKNDTIEMLKISSTIIEALDQKDEMPNGDFQAVIEAQVMNAYFLGQKSK